MNDQYVDALCQEVSHILQAQKQQASTSTSGEKRKKIRLHSIYFGGGTPSLAPIDSIRTILHAVAYGQEAPFALLDGDGSDDKWTEITMEMDPGTFTVAQLQSLKELGVNRISLGVQSFSDQVLEYMGRVHRRGDVFRAIQMIAQVYETPNYSIDLISGAPGVSLGLWSETLHEATTLLDPPPMHISVYDLQVEQGTVFGKLFGTKGTDDDHDDDDGHLPRRASTTSSSVRGKNYNNGNMSTPVTFQLPSEDECAFMYKFTSGYLKNKGYEHYEVSSYAYTREGPDKQH